jgi:monoterpene epsilon-lactone hydrolase
MPLTEEQRRALPELRAMFASTEHTFGSSMPFDKRAHLPTTGIPEDITAHVEIAPPLSAPLPLIDSSALKNPERVPIFYYSLRNEKPTASAPEDTKVIFFVHGGGNVVEHPTSIQYTDLFATMLRALATGSGNSVPCTIIAPCYRLATVPENTFPAALQDILAAYDFVINQGYKSSNITVAGDSAGGNHGERFDPLLDTELTGSHAAVVLTHLALQSNRLLPNGVIAIAPASLQAYDNLSEHAKAQASNDVLTLSMYQLGATAYIGNTGFAPTNPLISGSLISFTESWPKTLILIGTADQLIDASRELEKRLAALKRPVELVEYDERPHCWWGVESVFPQEIQDATERIARFVLG